MKKKYVIFIFLTLLCLSGISIFAKTEKNMNDVVVDDYNNLNYERAINFDEFSISNIKGNLANQTKALPVYDYSDNELIIEKYINNEKDEFLSYDLNFKSEYKIIFPKSIKENGELNNDGSYIIKSNDRNIGLITQLSAVDAKGKELKVVTQKYENKLQHSFYDNNNITYPVKIVVGIRSIRAGNYYNYFSDGYWIHRSEGISLSLYHIKTFYLDSTLEDAWSEVIYMHSSSPNWENEGGMFKQFKCHNMYASNKRPWNLEPWRPNVSMEQTVLSSCNP